MSQFNMYPQYQQPMMGYAPQVKPTFTQPLSIEKIRKMKNGGVKTFSTQITEEERDQAICTHKDPDRNNEFSLIDNPDGTSTCYICGKTFNVRQLTREEVKEVTDAMIDILQNIKTLYLDIPEQVATNFMMMIPLIERTPQLYELALSNFNKYDVGLHHQYNQNGFAILNSILSPAAMMPGYGYGGMNPGYGMPQSQFSMPTQGMQQPQFGYPMQNQMVNAFGYIGTDPSQSVQGQPQNNQAQQNTQNQGQGNNPTVTKVFSV